jgi:hypothetical protein
VLRECAPERAVARPRHGVSCRPSPSAAEERGDALAALETWLTGPFKLVPDPSIPYGGWAIKGLPPRGNAPRSDAGARATGGGSAVTSIEASADDAPSGS